MPDITPFLWFDREAEEAARFYVSVFPRSAILRVVPRNAAIPVDAGPTLTVEFVLDGRRLIALNGGPAFRFNEALSLTVSCQTQEEIDLYWRRLPEGGGSTSRCGWLRDRFGLHWQIWPHDMPALLAGPNAEHVSAAVMRMTRLDGYALRAVAAGFDPQTQERFER